MPFHLRTSTALTPEQWRVRGQAIQAELQGLSIDELLRGGRNIGLSNSGASGLRRHGYDPNQPRVPAGHPDGGQWTANGRGAPERGGLEAHVDLSEDQDEPFDFVRPQARFVSSRVTIDYSRALTGISSIDQTTRALSEILARTMQTMEVIPRSTPQAYGTAVHVAFGAAVRFAGIEGIGPQDVEHSWIDRRSAAHYGEEGSVRTDVVLRNAAGEVIAIYDLKTGGAKLTPARLRQLRQKTGVGPNVPIIEMHVLRGARLTSRFGTGNELGSIIAQLGNRSSQDSWGQGAFS
jgi:hypothetical protein